jgi:predicted RNA-binding Zn ribbon-like protein
MPQSESQIGGATCLDFVNGHSADLPVPPRLIAAVERFRATLRRLLSAEATGVGADPKDLELLNRVLARAGSRRGLVSTVRGYGWGWLHENETFERLVWPVAFSAARLLEGADLERLKSCGGCGRLFLDASPNRSRRWCDMQTCGNRAKVARFRTRKD